MGLLTGESLESVVQLLERRGVKCYHACQLRDFKTYLRLGGIPSRKLMEASQSAFTPFATDQADRRTGSFSKVFLNLADFGLPFAKREWRRQDTAPVPNPYGPILLVSGAAILREATDVAICLRSAGAAGFDREAESLGSAAEVERIFKDEYNPAAGYANAYIKYSDTLKEEFKDQVPVTDSHWRTLNPEISCSVDSGLLSLNHLTYIIVEEYEAHGSRLWAVVKQLMTDHALRGPLWPRFYKDQERVTILSDVGTAIEQGESDLAAFAAMPEISEASKQWAARLVAGGLGWLFARYSTYLREGTFSELGKAAQ